jgi:hypothetical protein
MASPKSIKTLLFFLTLAFMASKFEASAKGPDRGVDEGDCVECRLRQLERGTLPLTDKDSNANDLDQTARRIERSIQSVRSIHDQKQVNPAATTGARPNGRHPAIIEEL